MHPLDVGDVLELEGVLGGGLDDQRAGAQHPVDQAVPELDAVDAGQRDVNALAGDQAVAVHDAAVGDDEVRGPPVQERPHRQPQHQDQPDAGDDQVHGVLGVGLPVQGVDVAGDERGGGAGDDEQQRGNGQPSPVRVTVQDDVLVLGQHILRVAHGSTVLRRRGRGAEWRS